MIRVYQAFIELIVERRANEVGLDLDIDSTTPDYITCSSEKTYSLKLKGLSVHGLNKQMHKITLS